jgi:hypothetical protein
VCGLGVCSRSDGTVCLMPGVAIDGYGREIIVPEMFCFDPRRLTDNLGRHTGETSNGQEVLISLAYAEVKFNKVPIMAPDCIPEGACEYGNFREGFAVIVQVRQAPGISLSCSTPGLFNPDDPDRQGMYEELVRRISQVCPEVPEPAFAPLALVSPVDQESSFEVDQIVRQLVINNLMLLDLILCLAVRVDECCNHQPPPPQAEPLWVTRLKFIQFIPPQLPTVSTDVADINLGGERIIKTFVFPPSGPFPDEEIVISHNDNLIAFEVTFNHDVDPSTFRTYSTASQDEEAQLNFLVWQEQSVQPGQPEVPGQLLRGHVTPDPLNSTTTFRFRIEGTLTLFPMARYKVTLRGDGDNPIRAQAREDALDGNRDGTAGGNFNFEFRVE